MKKFKKRNGALSVALLAVCMMGGLLGWAAYAEDSPAIDQDVEKVTETAVSGSPLTQPSAPSNGAPGLGGGLSALPLPPGVSAVATQFMQQLGESVQSLINSTTKSNFYGEGIEASKAMVTRHFSGYCAGKETGNCPSDPLLQYGDVKVTSILSGAAYNGPRAQAAQDYLTNLFVPPTGALVANFSGDLKNNTLDVDTIVGDPKLLKKYTQALSDETVLSVPKQSFVEMIARRTVSGSNAGSVSEMQLMEAEAIKRFMSASWVQAHTSDPSKPADVQKEMALMQAYQNWMSYQQFRQFERIEALLATLIVQNARSSQALTANLPATPSSTDIGNAVSGAGSAPPPVPNP